MNPTQDSDGAPKRKESSVIVGDSCSPASLRQRLRESTQDAHQRLESALGSLNEKASQERILRLLGRFYGFHAAWEPALEAVMPRLLVLPRRRLALLQSDLERLGGGADQVSSLPDSQAVQALCSDQAAAAGSLYVLEGSTLGGQLITRALKQTIWYPADGLRYFDPYGTATGQRWKETVSYLDSLPPAWARRAVASALDTFELLESWLPDAAAAPSESAAAIQPLASSGKAGGMALVNVK